MLSLHFEMGPRGKRSKTATRSFDGESLKDYASGRRDDALRERKSPSEVALSPASEDVTPFSVALSLCSSARPNLLRFPRPELLSELMGFSCQKAISFLHKLL